MSRLTEAQRQAVEHAGNTLLKAGAGTGKTSTLVQRVLHWVTEKGHSIDRLLMVTFTEASAAEMRQRIRESLMSRLEAASTDEEQDLLGEQLARLEQAQISTLHSFCLRLVKENFHLLGIDPDVRVLDDQQTRPLEERLLDELMRERVAGQDEGSLAVQRLIRTYAAGNRDRVQGWIKQVHRFVRTLPAPDAWIEGELAAYAEPEPIQWREWLGEEICDWRTQWIPRLEPLRNENDFVEQALAGVRAIPVEGDLLQMGEALALICKPGRWANGTDAALKKTVNKCYDEAAIFADWLELSEGRNGLDEDWDHVRGDMATLLRLVREFDRRFTEAKGEIGGIDFADQEQLTLRLLLDETTGVAVQCRDWFQQVMIDEAQDINRAQDAILREVSGENRFIVGDIKQCIYQFRLTDPRIFDGYATRWSAGEGRVIPLQDNFRSHEGVVCFVNRLFESIMVPEVGGMDYDESARLEFGAPDSRSERSLANDPAGENRVEINFLAAKNPGESVGATTVELEARMVASRLRELKDREYQIQDPETDRFRPVDWQDMAVLLRSPSTGAETYVQEFRSFGIPLQAKRAGFYSSMEVADLINLMRLLDNPRQDIPLLAVLRSPLVGWSVEELGWLRVGHGRESCWESLARVAEAEESNGIKEKATAFKARFDQWRSLVRQSSLSHALEVILEQTHYEALLAMQPRGAERAGNLRRLLELARQYDPYQRQGLHRFIRFIDAQEEANVDLEPAPPAVTNSVRLMSVHQSKGLEFPVVAVGGMGKQFNEQDYKAALTVDEDLGLCPQVFPGGPEQRYPSLPLVLARRRGRRELRGEELRLLYVACTRAKDRLILAGAMNSTAEDLEDIMARELGAGEVAAAKGTFDWLLPWLGRSIGATGPNDAKDSLSWDLWTADDVRLIPAVGIETDEDGTAGDPFARVDSDALADRLEFAYPFAGASVEAAKTSVSDLRKRAAETDDVTKPKYARPTEFEESVPTDGRLSAADLGTLHHSFLQQIDPWKASSPQELKAQANRLLQAGELDERGIAALDFPAIAGFWASSVGRSFLSGGGKLERELPFTARFGTRQLAELNVGGHAELGTEDFVVVQGVVDLALIGESEIVIADYKTDHFRIGDLDSKLGAYVPQLRLYAEALEMIYRRPVRSAWLYFLAHGKAVDALKAE